MIGRLLAALNQPLILPLLLVAMALFLLIALCCIRRRQGCGSDDASDSGYYDLGRAFGGKSFSQTLRTKREKEFYV
ncbi:hypothetical protein DdX_00834 [Ditylenchus destructor]|uniref:Uncharacterized protein n=1 Tax=Ditylenchus destructor TaxID=166010 RepID=A0AAD4NEG0_9BILA|nr:hypothetical protein DdX_00834 [Ditylenchus destructor]